MWLVDLSYDTGDDIKGITGWDITTGYNVRKVSISGTILNVTVDTSSTTDGIKYFYIQ